MTTLNQIFTILGLIGAILLFGPFAFQVVMVILACIWRAIAYVFNAIGEFVFDAAYFVCGVGYHLWDAFKKHRENIRKNGRSL